MTDLAIQFLQMQIVVLLNAIASTNIFVAIDTGGGRLAIVARTMASTMETTGIMALAARHALFLPVNVTGDAFVVAAIIIGDAGAVAAAAGQPDRSDSLLTLCPAINPPPKAEGRLMWQSPQSAWQVVQ